MKESAIRALKNVPANLAFYGAAAAVTVIACRQLFLKRDWTWRRCGSSLLHLVSFASGFVSIVIFLEAGSTHFLPAFFDTGVLLGYCSPWRLARGFRGVAPGRPRRYTRVDPASARGFFLADPVVRKVWPGCRGLAMMSSETERSELQFASWCVRCRSRS